jgi:molecular chaperone GrpE
MTNGEPESTAVAPVEEGEGEVAAAEPAGTSNEAGAEGGTEAIQEELGKLQLEVDRLRELYLRKLADFDNYRKRQEREAEEFRRFANASLIRECLPVLDNLERALAAPGAETSSLRTGVELVLRQFKEVLAKFDVVEVNPQGLPFDPAHHEAIGREVREGVAENTVVAVLQRGYLLGEKLLRPALVVVAVPPAAGSEGGVPS